MRDAVVIAAVLVVCAVGAYRHWLLRPVVQSPGVLASDDPVQGDIDGSAPAFHVDEYAIQALASYHLRARLLGRETYRFHREADLSPLDFAVGWGPMSDSALLGQFELSQASRFFTLRWRAALPLPEDVVFDHVANMHLIPADDTVRHALDRMRPGEIIELDGYLVRAEAPDGWSWSSSLTRTDRGAGACELMWVARARAI